MKLKTSILFKLVFAKNTISSCCFLFLIIGLYSLIPEVIQEIFNSTAELRIIAIPTGEQNAKKWKRIQ